MGVGVGFISVLVLSLVKNNKDKVELYDEVV